MKEIDKINRGVLYFKGFGINYVKGSYRASSYANPTFEHTNLRKVKQLITQYLNR